MPKRKRTKKRKLWSVARITHPQFPGYVLRVTELRPGGNVYAVRMVDGRQRMASLRCTRADLGTTEREQERAARAKAFEIIAALVEGHDDDADPAATAEAGGEALTLGTLTDLYAKHGLHGRGASYVRDQVAKMHRIAAFLGADRPVVSLGKSNVEAFAAHRREQGVRPGTIHGDIAALKIAINFAIDYKRMDGRQLLDANPLAKVRVPKDKQPRRPWATEARYRALKAVAPHLPPEFGLALDLAWHTGRRIGAILSLRWQDVSFEVSKECPNGTVRWYAGAVTNNKRRDQVVPLNRLARGAFEQYREQHPGIGSAWVFAAPKDPTQPLGRWMAKRWLRAAERLAELTHEPGGGWHEFRRGWATARKHLPLVDVAEAGGWRDTATLAKAYTHPDAATTLNVIEHNGA